MQPVLAVQSKSETLAEKRALFRCRETSCLELYCKGTTFPAGGWAMADVAVRWRNIFSWFSQLLHDCPHLSGREGFARGVIACLLEFVPERFASANPSHEVVDCRARITVGEVQEGKLLLRVWVNGKSFHP